MTTLWFCVPAKGRVELTEVCLRQLARTCETLTEAGVRASAIIGADDENLEVAQALGFGTVERDNSPLGRKWNDLLELSGRSGVDYVIPCGSDDWIDPRLILAHLEQDGEIHCSRLTAVVSEDGSRLARLNITYDGGDGIRMIPTSLLAPLRYRPCEEDRQRALDTSMLRSITNSLGRQPQLSYTDVHPLQVVDWKSPDEQLNSYAACQTFQEGEEIDPWGALAEHYPAEALDEMRRLYAREAVAA